MKPVNKLIFLLTLLICSHTTYAQNNSFYVKFEQNGRRIYDKNGKVELKKDPFTIIIEYIGKPFDLKVHTSVHPKVYKRLKDGKLVRETAPFAKERKDAPDFFTQEKVLPFNSEDNYFLWKQNNLKSIDPKHAKAFKNVEKLQINGEILPLAEMKKNIYLTFVYTEPEPSGDFVEVQRETFVLHRVNTYKHETKAYRKELQRKKMRRQKEQEKQRKEQEKINRKDKQRLEKLKKHKTQKTK